MMATIKFEDEKKQVQVKRIPGFGFIDCTDDDDDFGFSGEMPAHSAGAASRRRKLLGEVIHPAAPAGAEEEAAKGHGGIETAPTSDMWQGRVQPLVFPERGGAWSRVFVIATTVARHSLVKTGGGDVDGQVQYQAG